MDTIMVDEIYLNKKDIEIEFKEYRNIWDKFLSGDKRTPIENAFSKVEALLQKDRWVVMEDEFVYDNKIKACWYGLMRNNHSFYGNRYNSGTDLNQVLEDIKNRFINELHVEQLEKLHVEQLEGLDLPTYTELYESLTRLNSAPFSLCCNRPNFESCYLYKNNNKVQRYYTDKGYLIGVSSGLAVPLLRLTIEDNFNISNREVFFRWLDLGLIPKDLKDDKDYIEAKKFFNKVKKFYNIEDFIKFGDLSDNVTEVYMPLESIIKKLQTADTIRANIIKYDSKIFYDANKGSWELYKYITQKNTQDKIKVELNDKLFARDPKADIIDGIIGIDFGTKSTVVVYSKDNEKILTMRVGIGDWSKKESAKHFENPTIMEFNNLDSFLSEYRKDIQRPNTSWKDLTISHTAYENLQNSKSDDFNAYLTELKQWAGDKRRKLKIKDKTAKNVYELSPFLELKDDDINPIEIYAYYLGLYINNQYNGIYLDYILSFPVTYEQTVRQKILDSFKKGIKKSLPLDKESLSKLNVTAGVSEPAAYAAIALQNYGFEDKEKSFYAIFDFGGGTTDFDFGIFRFSDEDNKKERRYDYVIEHFGAGGDRYLGGENLLELLAFEVFKANKDELLKNKISFELPPECSEFLGSEVLLNDSREAKLNMVSLISQLRKFWEREDLTQEVLKGQITIDLYNNDGELISQMALKVDEKQLYNILYQRIKKGVDAFFEALREVFANYADDIELKENEINIFLAGNSSKSPIVKEIFDKRIEEEQKSIEAKGIESKFNLFLPLDNKDDFEKPNGKTGVAYGLIETRAGGSILVIDKNIQDNDIKFKYYLGINKRKKFKVKLDRETEYNQWIEFIDAGVKNFEVYYTSSPLATTNNLSISDSAIKRKRLEIDIVDEDKNIYIKLISPTIFEYGVGIDGDIKKIAKVELNN